MKIADLDVGQGTSFNWQGRRLQNDIKLVIPVEAAKLSAFDPHALRLA